MAARFASPDGGELIGYTDRWSVAPSERIQLMASATVSPVTVQMVRLRHGDPNPAGPGLRAEPVPSPADGEYRCSRQTVKSGSFAVLDAAPAGGSVLSVWAWTRLPARGRRQVLLARGRLELFLDANGVPSIRFGDVRLPARQALGPGQWTRLGVSFSGGEVRLEVAGIVIATEPTALSAPAGPVTLAASADGNEHFNGRLEELQIDGRRFDVRDLRLVNGPMLAVTGRRWDDDTTDYRGAHDEYAAVHFHEDDVEDAGWPPVAELVVPATVGSGVYAFRLTAADLVDHVPFVVTPPRGRATASIGLLLPTLTYLAYSNERMISAGEGGMVPAGQAVDLDPADNWLSAHPEAGLSAYDRHADGTGCCLVSMRRPVPNFRPDFTWWNTGAPERFGADLYIADFLDQRGEPWDAFTDHDLHEQGIELLNRYRVIVTGTHPEYCSGQMLAALRHYLNNGGRMMYLGGNGFYWVTSIDPQRPFVAEVRRGINGTRAWTSLPGELRHQTTGEQGGLWRYRMRPPNALVGVGFTAQSDSRDRAPGYRRTHVSFEPAYGWIFEGVSDADVIGDYGLSLGGAAGYEIDRHDPALGSADESVVLMTSQGMHPDSYLLVVEDAEVMIPNVTGGSNPRVRSDVVYLPYEGGGAVFSVGSCSWSGSLSHHSYDNDIYRITDNVLTAFVTGGVPATGKCGDGSVPTISAATDR
jgi:N,N-dimethylformamidase